MKIIQTAIPIPSGEKFCLKELFLWKSKLILLFSTMHKTTPRIDMKAIIISRIMLNQPRKSAKVSRATQPRKLFTLHMVNVILEILLDKQFAEI